MSARPRGKELARTAELAVAASATYFTVIKFVGRDARDGPVPRSALYDRTEFHSAEHGGPDGALAAARAARDAFGTDSAGRRPVIYAVSPSGMTAHIE